VNNRKALVGSLALLVAAVFYNVWVFTRPAETTTLRGAAPVDALPTLGGAPAPAVDPLQIGAPPPVAMDAAPEWPRDPFANPYEAKPAVQAAAEPAPEPEPEVTVATILYGADRRLAIVNGRIVRVGDRVGPSTVVEIQPRAIVLDGGPLGRRVVPLRMPGVGR
jgi:hypothetical protein